MQPEITRGNRRLLCVFLPLTPRQLFFFVSLSTVDHPRCTPRNVVIIFFSLAVDTSPGDSLDLVLCTVRLL